MSNQNIMPEAKASRETHLIKAPKLRHGGDEEKAAQLEAYIDEAESGLRSILKAGFYIECLAADLPHGKLGAWVEAHCPKRKWRTVQRWKQVAAGVGDAVGINYKQRLKLNLHEMLALPLDKVPDQAKPIREKIDAEIAGKSYRQMFLTIAQIDEDKEELAPKRGRRKGQGGATKLQREAAQQRDEQARIEAIEIKAVEVIDWIKEHGDAKGFGAIGDKMKRDLREAFEFGAGCIRRLGK